MRNVGRIPGFDRGMVDELARLPGFRNVLVHEYVGLDYEIVLRALHHLEPVQDFASVVAKRLATGS